jgi:hypothetical protein
MWVLNNVRIFVTSKVDDSKQIIARLQPVQDSTLYQTLGWEKDITKLGGYIVGNTDKSALKSIAQSGLPVTLSGYGINYGRYYLNTISFEQKGAGSQTLRNDLDCEDVVFTFTAELYKELD